MPFRDRTDAGRRLAVKLARFIGTHPMLLALPRGGVPVGAEVAWALGAPLDVLLVRKVGVPRQPEVAMAAVARADIPVIVRNEHAILNAHLSQEEFRLACDRELAEIDQQRARYQLSAEPPVLQGRTVIVIDDGCATGTTARAALEVARAAMPAHLVLAVPVGPSYVLDGLLGLADEIVCLERPDVFFSVGDHYDDFESVSDAEVIETITRFAPSASASRSATVDPSG